MDTVSDTVHWWNVLSALGPLAVLLAAGIAGAVAWVTYRAQQLSARREEWWVRAQWALDHSLAADPQAREIGLGVLNVLATSVLAGPEELRIITVAAARALGLDSDGGARVGGIAAGVAPHAVPATGRLSAEDRVRVRAARVRATVHRRLGQETDAWVTDLAQRNL
ncbi:hypothetical protein [Specibacter sp. RAF43]|uniref:hypothetical protein n=1 Tax=Specibacter sp. RAF43 TaxID=3233057 RepID=UPI003F98BA23